MAGTPEPSALAPADGGSPGFPLVFKVVLVVLALIGLFSISGWIIGTLFWLLRAFVVVLIVLGAFVVLRAILGRGRGRDHDDA